MVVLLMLASIVMFIGLIHRVGTLQVNRMLIFTGNQGREIIAGLYPPIDFPATSSADEADRLSCTQTVLHHPRVVQAVHVTHLVRLGSETHSVIEILAAVGDSVLDSTPILGVLGGTDDFDRSVVGWNRTRGRRHLRTGSQIRDTLAGGYCHQGAVARH